MVKTNILITGGAGFIGSEIVTQLAECSDYDITVLDSLEEHIHGQDSLNQSYLYKKIKDKCQFIHGSVTNLETLKSALLNIEVVIHLASETGTGQSMYMINQYNDVNIMGTSNLFQAISDMGFNSKVKKIILSSSRSVYGEGKYKCENDGFVYPKCRSEHDMLAGDYKVHCPICGSIVEPVSTTEDSMISPSSLYAFTKYSQEMMIKTMAPSLNIDYTIFRFQNVYGVGQSLRNPYTGILSIFSTLLLENKPINIFEDGLESRDFINVKDIASGVILSIDNKNSNGKTLNLGTGIGTSVISIVNCLKELYGSSSQVNITGDFRKGDIANNFADISAAKEILFFSPTITLQEGLTDFCKWVKCQEIDNSGYEQSLQEMKRSGMFISKS